MTLDAFIGLVMLLVLLGAIFIGVPISFTLLFLAFSFGYLGMGATVFDLAYFQTIGMMKEELLAAVPLFVLAMATGIVGAAVTVLGIMASPIMIKSGYDAKLSAGTITAGGTLGILIPPSVMLIVMGPVLGVSVADLYAAAFGPGFLLAGIYVVYLMARSIWNPKLGPPVPKEERVHSFGAMLREVIVGVVPLIGLITATLGSILAGLATPTEASGIGTVGALALALAYRKLSFAGLQRALNSTMSTTSMVLLLAVTSNIFGAVFARLGTANWITNTLLSFELPPMFMLVMVLVLIFLLGWPFEWPAIVLVFLPIFYPVVAALKIDMIWFGALTAVTLQTAFLSPPVAMSAYYLKQVVKDWSLTTIYNGMFQFMVLQVICIGLLIYFPQITLWFPERLQAAARAEKIPEEYRKIIEQQRNRPSTMYEDDYGTKK